MLRANTAPLIGGLLLVSLIISQFPENPTLIYTRPVSASVEAVSPGLPVRLLIPSIEVDALVQDVGLADDGSGELGVPDNFRDVGWYRAGAAPGEDGIAVMDGHVDGRNVPKAVFYNLAKLKQGDLVKVVDERGQTFEFVVLTSKIYDYDAQTDEVFRGDNNVARLNLITCAGAWNKATKLYDKRVVVFTELVNRR